MKKLLFILLLFPLATMAQSKSKGFIIQGTLTGFPDGTPVRLIKNGESTEMATATLQKSKFTIKGNVKEPVLCFLTIDNEKPAEIFIENRTLSFKGNKAQPGQYEITGSASQKVFSGFIKVFIPLVQQISALANSINNTGPGPEREGMMNTYNGLQQNLQKEIDNLVTGNPRSYVSAFILNNTFQFNEDVTMLEKRFNSLDAAIKKSETGRQLESFIAEKKIGAIGTLAMDFIQPDTTGAAVSLSSFRGRYVLVDFWASWCGPCRNENPNVVENFNKFKTKNFTVLGVSLDKPGQKEKWINAIKEDNLTWSHVSDLQFWNNAAAQLYRIQSIPQNMLVDPEGKIIAKNLRGSELQSKLCEVLGCN